MDFANIDLRHDLVRELALRFYTGLRSNKWKGKPTPTGVLRAHKAWEGSEYRGIEHPLVAAMQDWRGWDVLQTASWIYGNVEKALQEVEVLWPKVRIAAMRLRNNGELKAAAVRGICTDILGAGLKGNRRTEAISRFYFDTAYYGVSSRISINDGVPFVKMAGHSKTRIPATFSAVPGLLGNLGQLSSGEDAGASAARLLMLLHTGNYVIANNRLCRVSLPVEPTTGNWGDISRPETIYPMPADYQWCARRAVRFAIAGFIWPTATALQGDWDFIDAAIDEIWIPAVFEMFFVIAGDGNVRRDCAMAFTAAIYSRLAAIQGWLNPLEMREKLREIFLETVGILRQFSETVADLEQALAGDLFRNPDDIIKLAGGAVDAGLDENERLGTLIRYQREIALYAAEAHPEISS
jgi:hypothetical protein